MAQHIQLTNADVNSGTAVNLLGASFTVSLKKNTEKNPLVGNTTYRLPKGTNLGINPVPFTIQGVLDVDEYTNDSALWGTSGVTINGQSNCVTLGILYTLWKSQSATTMAIKFGKPDAQKSWYNHQLTNGTITILIDDISFSPDSSSDASSFVQYTLTCVEVRPD